MRKLLLQLDSSRLPSVFDQVVAYDAGADEIMSYGGITEGDVRDLIHGCIFTRGAKHLHNTAVWIGGNNMSAGEQLLAMAQDAMFDPLRVSVMLDSNGSNTTAVAAVVKIEQTLGELQGPEGGHPRRDRPGGPACRRPARARRCARHHHVAQARAGRQGAAIHQRALQCPGRSVDDGRSAEAAWHPGWRRGAAQLRAGRRADGAQSRCGRRCKMLKVAVDLNAVPPLGIEGIDVDDEGAKRKASWCSAPSASATSRPSSHKARDGAAVHPERPGARRRGDRGRGASWLQEAEVLAAMPRVVGVDPGTISIDVCGLDAGEPYRTSSIPTAEALADPGGSFLLVGLVAST